MKRIDRMRILLVVVLLVLAATQLVLSGCAAPNDAPGTTGTKTEEQPGSDAAVSTQDAGTPDGDVGTPDGSSLEDPANAPSTITVRLYWVEAGENALGVERTLPYTQAVATASVTALLAGPTTAEQATWPAVSSAIPAGTRLLGLTVADGIARVDLSREFESGGGTFSVTARLAQVVYTLDQFPTIDAVEFSVEGVRVEMFSGEGLILEGPQTLDDYDQLLPIDA